MSAQVRTSRETHTEGKKRLVGWPAMKPTSSVVETAREELWNRRGTRHGATEKDAFRVRRVRPSWDPLFYRPLTGRGLPRCCHERLYDSRWQGDAEGRIRAHGSNPRRGVMRCTTPGPEVRARSRRCASVTIPSVGDLNTRIAVDFASLS